MKTKYPNLFGILAALMLVASFVVPTSLVSPASVAADPGICKWDTLREPNALIGTAAILRCSDTVDFVVASDFNTVYAIVNINPGTTVLYQSAVKGLLWSLSKYNALIRLPSWTAGSHLYQVAVSPDNPNFLAVTSGATATGPRQVWVSQNGGSAWDFTNLVLPAGETIRAIDISVDYGGKRDLAVATASCAGSGHVYVVKSTGFSGWTVQNTAALGAVDFFALKFSPSYASDASLVLVFADNVTGAAPCDNVTTLGATFYNVALRDIDQNTIPVGGWAFAGKGIEVKDATWPVGASPSYNTLNKADLELPSDFSGQAASLRRAYISLDAMVSPCPSAKGICDRDGIFRIDDSTVYTLMDTSNIADKSIYSIAYFGTYASGKLLAGERLGYPCTATVPTWFTDSPTTCPIPCWYPALKPTTGAACLAGGSCAVGNKCGVGAAIVAWAPPGTLAYVATGAKAYGHGCTWFSALTTAPVCDDESAVAISRNNGETWNQVSLIDTVISKFTDIAPTPDCKTVYLASSYICGAPTGNSVSITANMSCSSAGCTIAAIAGSPTASSGLTIVDWTLTGTCSYSANTCTCTLPTLVFAGNAHCTCTTCLTCTVPFSVSMTAPKTIVTTNGTAAWSLVTLTATGISCATQPGCTTPAAGASCCCFDSVWRSTLNPDVASPLAAQPVGILWERVFTHVTAPDCTYVQTDMAILRLVPYCADPTGEIVGWAVYDPINPTSNFTNGVAAWSPDFGDFWAMLQPRNPVQDFAFESRTVLYFLSPGGLVQKMPYTGTSWSSSLPNVDSGVSYAHTIAAYPEGKVLVGAHSAYNAAAYATSYSANMNTDNPSFTVQYLAGNTGGGNVHVAFDPNFKDNNTYYIGVDDLLDVIVSVTPCIFPGSVYRNNPAAQLRWQDTNMMSPLNGAVGCPHPVGQYGLALAFTGSALYSAHGNCTFGNVIVSCGVDRTIDDGTGTFGALSGMPKPGIAWDHMSAGLPTTAPQGPVCFTLEPSSLKICGCCTLDTDSTLYAIDNRPYVANTSGLIWAFTDCLAKRGPALVTEDAILIGCDAVSGRSGEVNLCWEQLCVAGGYDLEISKNADFTIRVVDWQPENYCDLNSFLTPADVTAPCVYFPAGGFAMSDYGIYTGGIASAIGAWGNLECGHTYYWRVKARQCATGQVLRSPWSEVRSFTVKAGYPVVSQYPGLQLLAPANGSLNVPVQSPSFSWSPFGDATKYKFVLSKDANMTQIVKEAETTTTAYGYDGKLDYSTSYFWRVMAEEPAPSDWSATFSFQTEPKPLEPADKVPAAPTPIWVWVVIAIGAILVIVTLVLIFKTRRV